MIKILEAALLSEHPIQYIAKLPDTTLWYYISDYILDTEWISNLSDVDGLTFLLLILESESTLSRYHL